MPNLFVYFLFPGYNSENCELRKLKYLSATILMPMYLDASHSLLGYSIGSVGLTEN